MSINLFMSLLFAILFAGLVALSGFAPLVYIAKGFGVLFGAVL